MAEQEQEVKNNYEQQEQDFTSDNFNTNIDNNYSSCDKNENEENSNNVEEENYNDEDDEDDEAERSEPEQYRKLFIGSLNYVTSEETMKKYFENYGKIDDCVIMKEPKTSKYVNL
jgi:RNA recognition motif-containing protein